MRKEFLILAFALIGATLIAGLMLPVTLWSIILTGPLLLLGFYDYFQTRHSIRRNFPLFGRWRYWLEMIRPEINQYFIESNLDGAPFSREQRSIVYQRAKNELDSLPFGMQHDMYETGYEWVNHSLSPKHIEPSHLRVRVGGPDCSQPYDSSILNISAMSFGSISKNAVLALNGAAKDGNFAHNTGEGGISPYHMEPGGDLIWQIGTGYFGCRTENGEFCEKSFQKKAIHSQVKMIEIKLSQGAKPGHGGLLPADKVSKETSETRGVPMGEDVISPPAHNAFSTPVEMMNFVAHLRELSNGKPVGLKICIGNPQEFFAICKAMEKTGITPDFISVDGGEGGTGAAPMEFTNYMGSPGIYSLILVENALTGFSVRDRIRITSGRVIHGFDIVKLMALGADAIYSARAMMMALGCIQALRCNSNHCPTGV
ncbi:MAG: FMN-binding glutamate synthase family protein, partial [Nitrospinae bacterium]|nr:FMN-binding glutamate synthase family protein [Nitrospinota bacterium]